MTKLLASSSRTLNADFALVILAGVLMSPIFSDALVNIALIGWISSFVLVIILSGRIVSRIENQRIPPAIEILKSHWFNYLVVVVVVAAPLFLAKVVIQRVVELPGQLLFQLEIFRTFIIAVTIYVLPIVISKRHGLIAILIGVQYLIGHFRQSILVIFVVIVGFAISASMFLITSQFYEPGGSMVPIALVGWLSNVATMYVSLLAFTIASTILLGNTEAVVEIGT